VGPCRRIQGYKDEENGPNKRFEKSHDYLFLISIGVYVRFLKVYISITETNKVIFCGMVSIPILGKANYFQEV
jgi:hypothetical protein